MKKTMFAVYTFHSKFPVGIFFSKWKAEDHTQSFPSHVKFRIVRVQVIMKTGTLFEVIKHEYKHL